MTITLRPEQEKALEQAIQAGTVKSVDDFIATAIAGLAEGAESSPAASRREAVRRMVEFAEQHQLSLGEPVSRRFLHEGHRF